jgi:hypothetical protein
MIFNPPISVLIIKEAQDKALTSFYSYLRSMPHVRLSEMSQLPQDLDSFEVVVSGNTRHSDTTMDRLTRFVHADGGWHLFVDLSDRPLPEIFGVQQGPLGPAAELRILFKDTEHPLAARLPDAVATDLFSSPESLYGGLSFAFRSDSQPNLRLPVRHGFLQPP